MIDGFSQAILDSFIEFFTVAGPVALAIGLAVIVVRMFVRGVSGRL